MQAVPQDHRESSEHALGDFPGGDFFSIARAVSGDGSVVVGTGVSASGGEAFHWTQGGGMLRLWDVLLAAGVDPAADGWTSLPSAYDVSLDGNTVVGLGFRNGNPEAFVAVVPEPRLALAAFGTAALLYRRPGHRDTTRERRTAYRRHNDGGKRASTRHALLP
jgi:hypothetical protein